MKEILRISNNSTRKFKITSRHLWNQGERESLSEHEETFVNVRYTLVNAPDCPTATSAPSRFSPLFLSN